VTVAIFDGIRALFRRFFSSSPHPAMEQLSSARDNVVREATRLEREVDRNNFSLMIEGIRGERPRSRARRKKS
jgi:hypothetical protein